MDRTRVQQLGVGAGAVALAAVLVAVVAGGGSGGPDVSITPVDGRESGDGPEDDRGSEGPEDGDGGGDGDDPGTDPDADLGDGGARGPDVEADWAMAPRAGLDANGDGVTDHACDAAEFSFTDFADDGDGCYEVDPGTFAVTVDACATPGIEGATFHWSVAGEQVDGAGCEVTVDLPEGTHDVVVRAEVDGETVAGPTTVPVEVDDILIVAIGDSWTVGIGAPDLPGNGVSGPSEAALRELSDAISALSGAETVLADARARLGRAVRDLEAARSDAEDALDDCFTQRLGVTIVRLGGLGDCIEALGDLGVDLVSSVSRLRRDIRDAVDDIEDEVDGVERLVRDATDAVEDARRSVVAAVGNVVAPDYHEGTYMHAVCSRSANAGPAQAARRIEDADQRTSVTLLHLSCSGAKAVDLIGKDGQIDVAAEVTGDREIDLVLLGAGGNDMRLNTILAVLCPRQLACHRDELTETSDTGIRGWCEAWIVETLLGDAIDGTIVAGALDEVGDRCVEAYESALDRGNRGEDVPPGLSAAAYFDQLFEGILPRDACASTVDQSTRDQAGLAVRYDCVAVHMVDRFEDRLAPQDVVVWEYIDVVHGTHGQLCQTLSSGTISAEALRSPPGFSRAELAFTDEIFDTVNGEVRSAATRHGWTFVETHAGSIGHGMCADDNWIGRVDQWYYSTPGASSLAHPTIGGMNWLGRRIAEGATPLLR